MTDLTLPPPLGAVSQVAYVVKDMEQALNYWIKIMAAGPFFVFEHAELENQRYRGDLSSADVTLAVGNSGDTQIELIVCENQAPSVYKEFIDAGKSGVHHVGLMPTDYKATCLQFQSLGFDVAFECSIGGTDLVYFDTVDALGHFTEFWDNSDAFRDFQRFVKHAAQHWDGSDPIRTGGL